MAAGSYNTAQHRLFPAMGGAATGQDRSLETSMRKTAILQRYLAGLLPTFVGALLTELTGSVLPLAMGASVTLMCTVPVVRAIWSGRGRDQ